MPEDSGIMERHLQEGIRIADSFLLRECGAIRLPDIEVRSVIGRSFVAGWQLRIETSIALRRLNVFVSHNLQSSCARLLSSEPWSKRNKSTRGLGADTVI